MHLGVGVEHPRPRHGRIHPGDAAVDQRRRHRPGRALLVEAAHQPYQRQPATAGLGGQPVETLVDASDLVQQGKPVGGLVAVGGGRPGGHLGGGVGQQPVADDHPGQQPRRCPGIVVGGGGKAPTTGEIEEVGVGRLQGGGVHGDQR
jgi:hypothetical protein